MIITLGFNPGNIMRQINSVRAESSLKIKLVADGMPQKPQKRKNKN